MGSKLSPSSFSLLNKDIINENKSGAGDDKSWANRLSYAYYRCQQLEVMDHVQHNVKLHEQGKLLYGCPFIDSDAGGMMIAAEHVTGEELEEFTAKDPPFSKRIIKFLSKNMVHGNELLSTFIIEYCK